MDHNNTMEYRIGLEKQNKRNDQITELILDNCRASQISGLTDEFVNLETLSLINVGLTTLKGFPKLPKLKKLELSDNRLTGGLNHLHGSPNLQHLNISGNRIKDFEALEPLKEFHDLVSLDLYNCEVTKADSYRKNVFDLLPNLKALDGYDQDEREVADSDEEDEEGSEVDHHITRDDNESEEDEEDEEGSEVDNHITRDDNESEGDEGDAEGSEVENHITRDDNESEEDEEAIDDDGEVGEEADDDDDDDEEGSYGEESEIGDGYWPQDGDPYPEEISDEEYDDDEDDDVEADPDADAETSVDATTAVVNADAEVGSDANADEDNVVAETTETTETSEAEAVDKRGQKRKLEDDEGGDEAEETAGETAESPTKE